MSSGGPRKKGGGLFTPAPERIRVLGTLVWPTSFTVEVMRRFTNYTEGATWIATAQIRDAQFAGQLITLPWENLMSQFPGDGGWITNYVQQKPFRNDPYPPQINLRKWSPAKRQRKRIRSLIPMTRLSAYTYHPA